MLCPSQLVIESQGEMLLFVPLEALGCEMQLVFLPSEDEGPCLLHLDCHRAFLQASKALQRISTTGVSSAYSEALEVPEVLKEDRRPEEVML